MEKVMENARRAAVRHGRAGGRRGDEDQAELLFCVIARMRAKRSRERWAFAVRHRGLAADLWHDLAGDQLNLAALVTDRPEVDSLAACARIAGQQLRALLHRADADPAAKVRRVFLTMG